MSEIPKIYDVANDEMRPVTQDDIDMFETLGQTYGAIIEILRVIAPPAPRGPSIDRKARLELLRKIAKVARGD